MRILDTKFYDNKFRYIVQAVLSGLAVAAALLFFDVVRHPVIIASFGASGFIAFTTPHKSISRPRYFIGGYIVGILVGAIVHLVINLPIEHGLAQKMLYILSGSVAVSLAMFLMAITDTEHPPAASIALGLVINDWTFHTLVLIMAGIIVISTIQKILKGWMIDLI